MSRQTTNRTRIKSSSDLGAGVLISSFSALFLYLGRGLERGTAFQMGPGFFPTAIGCLALLVGLALVVKSLRVEGPEILPVRVAPTLLVLAAIISFALLINKLGLIASGAVTMALASLAAPQRGWLRIVVLSIAVSVFSGLLFVVALGLSIPLWPAI